MEPNHGTAGPDQTGADVGELILLNGRQSGMRRPLNGPLTLLGRSPGCEVRLNVEGIQPVHCGLVHSPDGLVLRDLCGMGGTLVNGEPASNCELHDGDTLALGPFHFRLSLPADDRSAVQQIQRELDLLQKEKDALRVQAAAVVAQQAALLEHETRLEQRRTEMKRQEEQLAAHLEDRRARLVELQSQVRQDRETLVAGRKALEQARAEAAQELEDGRKGVAEGLQRAETQRGRVRELRKRLKQRWHRHFDAERANLKRREDEVAARQREWQRASEALRNDRAAFAQTQLRHNGEHELSRRQLQAGWHELQQARRQWQETRTREETELQRRRQEIDRRQAAVLEGEQALTEERRAWEEMRAGMEREIEGLNNRIRNQRRKILDQQQEAARQESVLRTLPTQTRTASAEPPVVPASEKVGSPPDVASPAAAEPLAEGLAELERLAGEVLDQRLQLEEQCRRFLQTRERWREDHEAAVIELEKLLAHLLNREAQLDAHEQALEAFEVTLRERHERAVAQRQHLEGWHARLVTREAALVAEREQLQAAAQVREVETGRQVQLLAELRDHWAEVRGRESHEVQVDHERCQGFREQYVTLWEECFRKSSALERQQKKLAEKALALEQYRLEVIGQSPNSAVAERRMEKLRNQLANLSAAAQRRLNEERRHLGGEASRLNDLSRRLQHQAAELARREEELARRLQDWENGQGLAELAQSRLRQELQTLQAQRDTYERQLAALQQELERLARSLLDESETPAVFLPRAA